MTYEEAQAKKEKAVKLLESHEDEYRLFYVELQGIKTREEVREAELKRKILDMKADAIHTELKFLDELIYYRAPEITPSAS